MSIAKNLAAIHQQISHACDTAGRSEQTVQLLAVSKTKPMAAIQEAYEAGQVDFGENRPQELKEKHPMLPDARWHMIGHLQRNKVKYIAPFVHLIHAVDTPRLLEEISKQAAKNSRVIDCLLQLNISDEEAKSGLDEVAAKEILLDIESYPHVRILGLMGMASLSRNEQLVRGQFRRLRTALEAYQQIQHPRLLLQELSMGMSGDFQWAIAEGATMVRIGSAVFGGR